ncbi:hypothetical protein A2853_02425 [Candidatus Kaiserbacteria bacterium RIFCSPHIGHO2_01_FULL_55_17]|uniref:Phenylacetate--CoA ligase n=1 Tax=Candidatus Kaiserbacteria bacterium RIFCSPHIGHO2_01_FULL_55_17 TaxID=1798484 RepID=A0A1F6D7L2_9BACT|nr:MAG: hypothetical protein A2853_02425 [Candidatus Kaiserbacteria bacterium RIFCSPHIGHO2_01_FULL_55_17]
MKLISPKSLLSSEEVLKMIHKTNSAEWTRIQERTSLHLFQKAASRVPAYKDFLKKNKINPKSITSFRELKNVPFTNKQNYLRAYPMEALLWDGNIRAPFVFSATSGSTGKPFYFPHGPDLDFQYSILADLFLENGAYKNKPTLVLITFGMGVWIGGVFTFQAFELASKRGKNVSILTPGINKAEIMHALRDLAPNFTQTILIGYPPFVKDMLDDAVLEGIDLRPLNIRLMFAAEGFSERFRDHLVKAAHVRSPYLDTLNIYGTADIGAMAYETPTSILARRLALSNDSGFKALFGPIEKTPTLAQYNPLFTSFEAEGGSILLTGDNAMPLVRYAVGDTGGVHSFDELQDRMKENGLSLKKQAKASRAPLYQLPFVYVYERADFSTKLYGAIMYPEHVREALQDEKLLAHVTGRFAMRALTNEKHDQYLEVNVELREHTKHSTELSERVQTAITKNLLTRNSEYRNNHTSMGKRVVPEIIFWPHEDPKYFKPTIKQKWVIKE